MLTAVLAVGDTETKLEIKRFEQAVAEEVTFNHAEFADGAAAYCELHPGK